METRDYLKGLTVEQGCLGLRNSCLLRKAEASLEMDNVKPFPTKYYNFEIKELSGKDMGTGITVLY